MDRFALGWSPQWDHLLEKHDSALLVRVTSRNRDRYDALTVSGASVNCCVSGKFLQTAEMTGEFPAVGDWCVLREQADAGSISIIEHLLPRRSWISRLNAGKTTHEQVLAANIDYLFVTTSANRDFNVNRLRRYMLTAISGNTTPVIVLTKADLDEADVDALKSEVFDAFPDVLCIETSAVLGIGMTGIRQLLSAGKTAVFVGSSGVGKSTLVNALLESDAQRTSHMRESDQRGRHTTSSSGLFFIESGGIIIDTPGLREIQVLADADDLDEVMPSVTTFASECKFSDCSHTVEPGCRVQEAMEEGALDENEYASYAKLEREIAFSRRKVDQRLASEQRKLWKQRSKNGREQMKWKRREA